MNKTHSHHPPQFFISLYGWTYWLPILVTGVLAIFLFLLLNLYWLAFAFVLATFACLAFYRDFDRPIPQEAGIMVAPADGEITEISELPHYGPFNGPALKVSIFLSVLDVHVNRAPCDATVLWTRYEEGRFLDARHKDCSTKNQSNTIALGPPSSPATAQGSRPTDQAPLPIAIIKQIVGAIARRIIAPLTPGEMLTRGQRIGMIAFGSRTELYVPAKENWKVVPGLYTNVKGGKDILLRKSVR